MNSLRVNSCLPKRLRHSVLMDSEVRIHRNSFILLNMHTYRARIPKHVSSCTPSKFHLHLFNITNFGWLTKIVRGMFSCTELAHLMSSHYSVINVLLCDLSDIDLGGTKSGQEWRSIICNDPYTKVLFGKNESVEPGYRLAGCRW